MKQLKYFSGFLMVFALLVSLGCASTPKQEGTGEFVDDSVINTKVKAALLKEPGLKSFEIKVVTFKGVVQLSGFVGTHANMEKAEEITRNIDGVKSVKDDMRLKESP